jgi:hypothetical protein
MVTIMTLIVIVGDHGLGPVDVGSVVGVAGAVQGHILLIQVTLTTTIAVDDDLAVVIDGHVLGHQAFVLVLVPLNHPAELILMVQRIAVILPRVVVILHVLVIHLMAVCLYPTVHLLEPIILRLTNTTPVFIHPTDLAHAVQNICLVHLTDLLRIAHVAQVI